MCAGYSSGGKDSCQVRIISFEINYLKRKRKLKNFLRDFNIKPRVKVLPYSNRKKTKKKKKKVIEEN